MQILGIETSCDETAVAIVTDQREIKANLMHSQLKEHASYGGVVPEVASRAHLDYLDGLIRQAMHEAGVGFSDLNGIAVTGGPGLIGGVMVGVMMAKSIAVVHDLPFLVVNHLAGHALTVRLTDDVAFPYLLLLVSGGHCQLLVVEESDRFRLLGTTMDDAVGEAFDKTARLLGFPYPGGPAIEKYATKGNPDAFAFPRPLVVRKAGRQASPFAFSFSGLKTAVRQTIEAIKPLSEQKIADVCASFQAAVGDILLNRTENALQWCRDNAPQVDKLVVAGGVAANQYLRGRLQAVVRQHQVAFYAPPVALCTDNGAMIAWAGIEKLQKSQVDSLDFAPRPRWPLEEL
ncbi:MAG: tRNA (adenosine(37)-N6)-threonylcarbamoyltransferase complex transferase subunit TsaD [Pseudomonadota bacterium]